MDVHIHYLRPPRRSERFIQRLVYDDTRVKVTFARDVRMKRPLIIDGRTALESGSDAVWFTFPGAWHDIGRFHRADGSLSGIYANILTPCTFEPGHDWHTTDLFLDLWVPAEGDEFRCGVQLPDARILDEDELDRAQELGWVGPSVAARARQEASSLLEAAHRGRWPPSVVEEWTRERALYSVTT